MYLLMHKHSRPTGRKLAAALGMRSRFKSVSPRDDIAVRWGTAQFPERSAYIQEAFAIARAANKLIALQCFQRDGVPCPEFTRSTSIIGSDTWLGRSQHGSCGRDIRVYQPGCVAPPYGTHDFFSKYIPNRREYRVHVFGEEILGVMGKYLDFPAQAGDGFIKNYGHGYRFRTPSKRLNTDRLDVCVAAVRSLGLDFGAVDLLIGDDNKTYILEVNTAPALAPLTFDKYIGKFKERLGL